MTPGVERKTKQMNKWLAGGAALGFTAAGSLVLATPGGAQETPPQELQATIEPTTVPQGGTVTLSSIDNCADAEGTPGSLTVDIFFADEEDPFQSDPFDLVTGADPNAPDQIESAEGEWAIDYEGVPGEPTGIYTYIVTCFDDAGELVGEYNELAAETVAAPEPTTPPTQTPPAPAPASPIPREPDPAG
jgi:hypothetical protein